MAKPPLTTDRQLAALRPAEKPYEMPVSGAKGLTIRVFPTGTKSFELRYVAPNGVRRRLPLGNYPGLSLTDARADAAAHRVAVTRGGDPAAERSAMRRTARTGDTLSELADAYFVAAPKGLHGGRGRPKGAATLKIERIRFDKHISPALGSRRFKDLGRSDMKAFMRELATGGRLAPDTIASIGRTFSAILSFAVHEERLEANPVAGLTRPLALRTRERMPTDDTIATLWRALEAVDHVKGVHAPSRSAGRSTEENSDLTESPVRLALRFAMVTWARRLDVAAAEWSDIDLKRRIWTIPASRFKGRRVHVVPLSDLAITLLTKAKDLPGGGKTVVFPSPIQESGKPVRPIRADTLTQALKRTFARLNLPHGSPHDFRRAGATTLTGETYSFRQFVVGKVLGHASHDGAAVTSTYDRNDYLADKRRALEAWAQHIGRLIGDLPAPNNVTTLRKGKA